MENRIEEKEQAEKSEASKDSSNTFREELDQAAASGGAAQEMQTLGFLPKLDIDGLVDKTTDLAKDAKNVVVDLAKKTANGAEEAVDTIKNIPVENWKGIAGSAKELGTKHGQTIGVDAALVIGTEGANVLADGKLVLDIYLAATSPEGKEFGRDILAAWKEGEKRKNAA